MDDLPTPIFLRLARDRRRVEEENAAHQSWRRWGAFSPITHLSYSPRTACLASSFFMLAMPTETLTVPLTVTEPKSVGICRGCA
jgi:hypothetical protein